MTPLKRVLSKSWSLLQDNQLDIQPVFGGFILMLTYSRTAAEMSLAFDTSWNKLLPGS